MLNRAVSDKPKISFKEKWAYTRKEMKKNKISYVLVAPFMILFFIFTILPILSAIGLSFTDFNMLEKPNWVGWSNYKHLFLDNDIFKIVAKNTLIFAFLTGPLSYFLCLILAWFINELPRRLRTFMTFIFYAPTLTTQVFFVWQFIFSSDAYGVINGFLLKYNFIKEPIKWLIDPRYSMKVIILVQLWISLGVSFLAFIAGLQSVDKSLYEAGSLDGIKNRWQELIHITLPQMAPQLLFGAVMQIASSFAVGQVSMTLAGFPSTNYAADTIITHMTDYAQLRYEMGYAAAISVVLTFAMILTNKIIKGIIAKIS